MITVPELTLMLAQDVFSSTFKYRRKLYAYKESGTEIFLFLFLFSLFTKRPGAALVYLCCCLLTCGV